MHPYLQQVVAIALIPMLLTTGCRKPLSQVKKVAYEENTFPEFSLEMCDEFYYSGNLFDPKTHEANAAKDRYREQFYAHILDTVALRLMYLRYPPTGGEGFTSKKIAEEEVKSLFGDNSSCLRKRENPWWNPFAHDAAYDPSSAIQESLAKFNSEQEYNLIYPSFFRPDTACHKIDPGMVDQFRKQTTTEIHSQVTKLCDDYNRIDSFYLNPGFVASFFAEKTNDTRENRMGFCTARKIHTRHLQQGEWWDEVEPWLISGGAMAAGTLANFGLIGVGGTAVDWAAFGVSMASNLAKYKWSLEEFANLNEMSQDLDVSQTCSQDEVSRRLEKVKMAIVYDVIGQAVGFAIGWAAPGIGRGVRALFQSGKAALKSVSVAGGRVTYVVIPSLGRIVQMPNLAVFSDQILSAVKTLKTLLPEHLSKHVDDAFETVLSRYKQIVNQDAIHVANGFEAPNLGKNLEESIDYDAMAFGSKSNVQKAMSWVCAASITFLTACSPTFPENFAAPKEALDSFRKEFATDIKNVEIFDQHLLEDSPNLLKEEVTAINMYTSAWYRDVNNALKSKVNKFSDFVSVTVSGMRKLERFKGTVYRAATHRPETIEKYLTAFKNKEAIQELGFLSTTYDKKQMFPGNMEFIIESVSGVKVEKLALKRTEKEVLFAPGTWFEILDIEQRETKWIVKMRELIQ
ncbi:MAG: ADP-ribosyltransferase domain-containing protein [Oligoflexales bacterium]